MVLSGECTSFGLPQQDCVVRATTLSDVCIHVVSEIEVEVLFLLSALCGPVVLLRAGHLNRACLRFCSSCSADHWIQKLVY